MVAGDVIKTVNGTSVRHVADWIFSLDKRLPALERLNLAIQRGNEEVAVKLQAQEIPPLAAVEVQSEVTGLRYSFHQGKFNQMPDLSTNPDDRSGVNTFTGGETEGAQSDA